MNKKFFTLLAGAFLGFTAVSSVNAQGTALESQELRLVDYTVSKMPGYSLKSLNVGPNTGYYALQVDSVVVWNKTTKATDTVDINNYSPGAYPIRQYGSIKRGLTLYMGTDSMGQNALTIDVMGRISQNPASGTSINFSSSEYTQMFPSRSIGEESSAGLWCVTVYDYIQGQNPTYDFTNKLQGALLEVNAYDHEKWPQDPMDGWRKSDFKTAANTDAQTPGGLSQWEFSETYKTGVHAGRPLVAYLDDQRDTVAVLVSGAASSTGSPDGYVQIKIVPATEVALGHVDGMLLFTLKEAMPFALDKKSYETMLGSATQAAQKLVFSPDAQNNPFSLNKLTVEYLSGADAMLVDTSAFTNTWSTNYMAWDVAPRVGATSPWVGVAKAHLDYMGYVALKNGSNYVYVDTTYHNEGNTMFLNIKADKSSLPGATTLQDQVMIGQYAWRMVYYPSGDSIYINPFSATYVPSYDPKAITDSTNEATDSVTRSWYTYVALPMKALTSDTLPRYGSGTPAAPWLDVTAEERMTFRLKKGQNPKRIGANKAPTDYTYYHRLYVSLQNLTGGTVATLYTSNRDAGFKNNCINTQINFGIYTPCLESSVNNRPTMTSDLYLIRNEAGQYLHVPLYSAHDSAVWVYLDKDVHPELLPSFQWIVQSRYANGNASSNVNIINREFGYKLKESNALSGAKKGDYGLAFTNVQLQSESAPFKFRTQNYNWNNKNVNAKTVKFADVKDMGEKNGATFISLADESKIKSDPLLGYTWIDPDTSVVNLYGFNYRSGINDKFYIKPGATENSFVMGDYPNTDTLLYVNGSDFFDIGYFRIDTVAEPYGALSNYGYDPTDKNNQVKGLAQLKRQAYRIVYENPFKYCTGTLCLSNAEQGRYSLSSKLRYNKVLGKPVFWLRHVYHEGAGLTPDFALVQRIDTASIRNSGGYSDSGQLYKYVNDQLGKTVADNMVKQLKYAGEFNPGLFVVSVDDQTLKLKSDYRGDVVTRVSTFQLAKDTDPMYRRFNTEKEGTHDGDAPEIVKFYTTNNTAYQLFENTGALSDQKNYYTGDKNYLGLVNTNQNPNAKTAIYVDTAFVNRGKGYIRPQYMLMIRPTVTEDTLACDDFGELTIKIDGYKRGMYLINATDSADVNGTPDEDYIWNTSWERLVFTDAIHADDRLYILGGADLTPVTASNGQIDMAKLKATAVKASPSNKGKNVIQYYDLGETIKDGKKDTGWPTYKDCAFQFRLIERRADDFLIESETTDRSQDPTARPCYGGWIKIQNGVPVISRSDVVFAESQAEIFNVSATTDAPVANETAPATTEVKVVANNGSVTIMNAAGKKVVISNVLGQTVANTVLTSDNATIAAPQGVVVVAIEGEAAVKALVK